MKGDKIELSKDYPTGSKLPSIDLVYCRDVTIDDNEFVGFDWPIRIEKSENTSDVKVKNNKGVAEKVGTP